MAKIKVSRGTIGGSHPFFHPVLGERVNVFRHEVLEVEGKVSVACCCPIRRVIVKPGDLIDDMQLEPEFLQPEGTEIEYCD